VVEALQMVPHPPQCMLSLRVSTQSAPHMVLGAAQPPSTIATMLHAPALQT
jgi:hypothetical protein